MIHASGNNFRNSLLICCTDSILLAMTCFSIKIKMLTRCKPDTFKNSAYFPRDNFIAFVGRMQTVIS